MNAKEMPVTDPSKKYYTPPQIVFKQKLEAMAVACFDGTFKAKSDTGGGCSPNNLFS